jgi:N-acyl-D-amino-acid deacylase
MNFDSIIRGGTVVDGAKGGKSIRADVGITGDRIAAVGDLTEAQSDTVVDAENRIVCPGFIDVHVHSERTLVGGRDQFSGTHQGITTHLLAPDGFGWAPLSEKLAAEMWYYTNFACGERPPPPSCSSPQEYLDLFTGTTPANVAPQVPHCAVRLAAMGWAPRAATEEELDTMREATRSWMEVGATALNLGLDYQPSANATFEELVELCKVAASYGGIYAAHLRYQDYGRSAAWDEIIELSRAADIAVHVSHERVDEESLEKLERVERDGIDLTFESYLYPAGMTHGVMLLPMSYQAGSPEEVLARLNEPQARADCVPFLRDKLGVKKGTQIIGYTASGRFAGSTLGEAAAGEGTSCEDLLFDLILQGVGTFIFPWQTPDEENKAVTAETAAHPRMMLASDGVYDVPHPHPRGFGCFAQLLGRFVRERGALPLEEAVFKMSGFQAERFGLKDRGRLAVGMAADIVVFDPATVADRATWSEPMQPAEGVDEVMVNGTWAKRDGKITGVLPGRAIGRSR